MLKIRYIGPGNYHYRVGTSMKVYNFTPENDYTQIVDRDHIYDLIADKANGKYCRIEGDPKFNDKVYLSVGVSCLGDAVQPQAVKSEIKVSHETLGVKATVTNEDLNNMLNQLDNTDDVDKILTETNETINNVEQKENTSPDIVENIPDIVDDDLLKEIEQSQIEQEVSEENKIIAEVSSDVEPQSLVS